MWSGLVGCLAAASTRASFRSLFNRVFSYAYSLHEAVAAEVFSDASVENGVDGEADDVYVHDAALPEGQHLPRALVMPDMF